MTKDEALKLALEALELHGAAYLHHELRYEEAITTAKEALAQPEQKLTGIREIRVTETVKQEQEEDWDAMGQKILVATARDTKRTWEDAAVNAVHKLMQEEQEPVGFYVYKPTLPRGHLGNVSDGDLPWVYDQDPSSGYSARMLVYTTPLAQPKQEPVAWMCNAFDGEACEQSNHDECENPIPLYATPPKREWVGLTDEECEKFLGGDAYGATMHDIKAIEAKLKEKNHGL